MTWLACLSCDVAWRGTPECWSCGNPGVIGDEPALNSQHGSPLGWVA